MSAQSPQWIATARLLRRTGFGTTGPRVDAVVGKDWSTYLDGLLDADPDADPGARATPMPVVPTVPPYPRVKDGEDKAAADDQWNKLIDDQTMELSLWWVRRIAAVQEPIHEKLTLLWHNHFATSAQKVRYATYMGAQNQKLRTLKLGDFRELAYAMLTDAAMLSWLDGKDNVASSPNENLSREFMELFALGQGNGYTEADVKEGARALTGWTIAPDGQTRMVADNHDARSKIVLGETGNLDAAEFCDAVLKQPASATHVASRLWQQLASDTPPSPQALNRLVSAYGPGRDLKALTKAVLLDPEFVTGASVISPMEWMFGVIRTLGVALDTVELQRGALDIASNLGQKPLYPPDVSGWPYGRAWVSTASVASQTWAAGKLAKTGDLSSVEEAGEDDRIDAVGYLIGVGAWTDHTVAGLKPFAKNPEYLFTAAVNTPEYLTT
ncbi:MAG TPA: DUF1800 domain-containing protein [Mycobacterium sp.]|nr:DUF1800 domain-containing protein [Mycobacterium sp.]